MQIKWSKSAKDGLRRIQSIHFSKEETIQYEVHLVREIEALRHQHQNIE